MANLTNEQAVSIYNLGTTKKQRIDINDSFYTYRLTGDYLGFEYQIDSLLDGLVLDADSTSAEIETAFITELETRTFRGTEPIGKITNI